MKKSIFTLSLLTFAGCAAYAQNVGIGTAAPAASAKLDISSANSGILIPRVALTDVANGATPVATPATGLLVFNTNGAVTGGSGTGFYYWTGAVWRKLQDNASADWTLTGNAGTNAGTNFIGTTDGVDFVTRTNNTERMRILSGGNVGIGDATPAALFTVGNGDLFQVISTGHTRTIDGTAALPAYSFTGDTDNGLFRAGADILAVTTGGTERMRINAVGNMGLGTNAPDASARLDIAATDRGLLVPRVALTSTNVAAPVTAPATSLVVYNTATAGAGATAVTPGFYYWGGSAWIRFAQGNVGWETTGNNGIAAGNFLGPINAADLDIRTNNTNRLTVRSTGETVITNGMRIQSAANGGMRILGAQGNTPDMPAIGFFSTDGVNDGGGGNGIYRPLANTMAFSTTSIERMRINSGGQVGINVIPDNRLDIANATRTGTHATGRPLYVTGTIGADNTGIEFRHDNGTQGIGFGFNTIYATGTNANQDLGLSSRGMGNLNFSTNAAQRMIIRGDNGRVGVGTTNPAYTLDLNTGTFGFGLSNARTETRDNAGLQGNAGAQSGFYETSNPVNYPAGASGWWHLIDARHNNPANNYALQLSGSFFDQELWFRKTNNNAAQAWSRVLTTSNLNTLAWALVGNSGTNAGTNFIGTTDAVDFVTRTNNAERMRVTSGGNVGIGIAAPTQRLDVQGGNARINNVFVGDVGHGAGWAGVAHQNQANTTGYSLLASTAGDFTLINKQNTGGGYIGFRVGNVDQAVILNNGFTGIGTTAPQARLHVENGSIRPSTGNSATAGVYWTPNPGGGGGDEAYIRHYIEAGENTKLVIANVNDPDDDIAFLTGLSAQERMNINGHGHINIARGVRFDCNDCGNTGGWDNIFDGAGGNWGDLVIQGRVLSTNSNLHLSPPGGNRVIINSAYRAAGGAGGTTGLDIEDGGIRMRKNYMYFQRFRYCNCYGAGSATHNLGNWDFCAVAHVGFKNNQSSTDEDDDVQCAVYPNGASSGEQTNWDFYFTEQYNTRRAWIMYLEAFEDTNGVTCAASCWNLD